MSHRSLSRADVTIQLTIHAGGPCGARHSASPPAARSHASHALYLADVTHIRIRHKTHSADVRRRMHHVTQSALNNIHPRLARNFCCHEWPTTLRAGDRIGNGAAQPAQIVLTPVRHTQNEPRRASGG